MIVRQTHRRGFTLPEVLVTVAMIGILAAAVVPTVVGQLQKGDVGRMGDDVLAIRGAVEQFASDVRKYPASIGQLTAPLVAGVSTMVAFNAGVGAGASFTSADVVHWKGPYLSKDSVAAVVTAYGFTMTDAFVLGTFNPTDSVGVGGQKYLVLQIPGVDTTAARQLDNLYDDGRFATGFIRWTVTSLPVGTVKILMMPIQ